MPDEASSGKGVINIAADLQEPVSLIIEMIKNFYKGLRSDSGKVEIYGSQLFFYSKDHLNIVPDENEMRFSILPDMILSNGPAMIPKASRLNFAVGPSLSYAKINIQKNPH